VLEKEVEKEMKSTIEYLPVLEFVEIPCHPDGKI
jgi:hypothetical protein